MDTSSEAVDSLDRRTGPRQKHTIEQKRRIVAETHVRGVSAATVARRHRVNANQVFAWRQALGVECRQNQRTGLQRRGAFSVNQWVKAQDLRAWALACAMANRPPRGTRIA